MPLVLRSLYGRTIAALIAAASLAVAGCAGSTDATAPGGAPETSQVALSASVGPVAQVSGAAVTLRVVISYLRATGDSVPIGAQTFTLTDAATQQFPVTVDLAGCLNDAKRRGADLGAGVNGVCTLRLDLALLQGATVLDRQTVMPVLARPGQTTTPSSGAVALYTVANVALILPAGTPTGGPVRAVVGQPVTLAASATDAAGQPVTARTPVWTSDNPTVATVDSLSGVVTPRAPGRATITATVGGRSATVTVNVVLAPAPVTITVAGGLGSGTVTSLPAGINCQVVAGVATGTCSFTFASDAAVTLTATPTTGSSFATWGGDCATAGTVLTCQITPSVPRSATVTFVAFRALNVALAGNGEGTVTSQPAGINCQLTAAPISNPGPGTTSGACSAAYLDATTVTLTAAPSTTSSFGGWTGACSNAALTCTVSISQAQSVTATFVRRQATLTLTVGGSGAGTLTATGAGVLGNGVCVLTRGVGSTTCAIPVQVGSTVTITRTVGTSSSFGGWAGACAATTTEACSLTVTGDLSAGAVFTLIPVPLAVGPAAGNQGAGTVTSADGAIACAIGGSTTNGTCTADVAVGATVTLRSVPAQGQVFLGWGGACASAGTSGTCTFTATSATAVTVIYGAPQTLTLILRGANGAGGWVIGANQPCELVGSAGTITCTPATTFGKTVTLTAMADSASTFSGWGGACSGVGECSVTLDQPRTVVVNYDRRRATLTLGLSGAGAGTVALDGQGVCALAVGQGSSSCTTTNAFVYATVTLTAAAAQGSTFTGWGGACTSAGTNTTCTLPNIAAAASVTASFTAAFSRLTLDPNSDGTGSGTLTAPGPNETPGLSCFYRLPNNPRPSGTCSTLYPSGTTVTITQTPDAGSGNSAWSGACAAVPATSTTCTITMNQDRTAGAVFSGPYSIGVAQPGTSNPSTGGGTVTGTGSINCTLSARTGTSGSCVASYGYQNSVTYTARPDGASWFQGWEDSANYCVGVTAFSCAFTASRSGDAVARFSAARTFELDAGSAQSSDVTYGTVLVQTAGVPDQLFTAASFQAVNPSPRFGFGNTVTLTAQPAAGHIFSGWRGDCQAFGTSPVCTLTAYRPDSNPNAPTLGLVQAVFDGPQ